MRRTTPRAALAAGAAAVALVVSGLVADTAGDAAYAHYVALGDSFTAAPYASTTDVASGCLRGRDNYPARVARTLGIPELDDRSCTGAQTRDLAGSQRTRLGLDVAPQLSAVTSDTDLVTVGLGFNDGRLYGRIASRCRQLAGTCRLADEREQLEAIVSQVASTTTAALVDLRRRAPQARVLLVGYPRMLPATGDCAGLPTWREQDRATFRDLNAALDRQLALAAAVARVEYVDFYAHSAGHDVCSSRPWVEGRTGDARRAAALHPLPAGQRALAELLVRVLRQPRPAGSTATG